MNFNTRIVIFCIITLFFHFNTTAKDIYVNNLTGQNTNSGDEPFNLIHRSGPVRTISFALRMAEQGDRIVLANNPGHPYQETISLFGVQHSGDFEGPFTIEGCGAVLDGSLPISSDLWAYVNQSTFRLRPSNSTHFALFLDGKPLPRVTVPKSPLTLPELKPFEWCIFDQFVYIALEERKQPADYNLSCTEKITGITLTHVNHVQINDLAIQGYQIDGISARNMVDNLILDNISIRGNGRHGFMAGKFSQSKIGFSRIGDNGSAQLLIDEQAKVTSFQSVIDDRISPQVTNLGGTWIEYENSNSPEIIALEQLWDPIVVVAKLGDEKEQQAPTPPIKDNATVNLPQEDINENDTETEINYAIDDADIEIEEPAAETQESDDPFAF